jgi:hypothetical protein
MVIKKILNYSKNKKNIEKNTLIEKVLSEKFIGESIQSVKVDDTFELQFSNGLFLSAQNISFLEEGEVNEIYERNYKEILEAVDKENISKMTLLGSVMRKEIESIKVNDDNSLLIDIKDGFNLIINSNVDIVDWQWFIGEYSNESPYSSSSKEIITCFFKNEPIICKLNK